MRGLLLLLAVPAMATAQDDFTFDSSIFDDSLFAEAPAVSSPFTYKISQQGYAQINNHGLTGLAGPEDTGTEISRSAVLIKYQNAFSPGWLLQGSAQAKIYWPGDYEHLANDERVDTELRINELFIQRSGSRHSLSFGRQTVVWGETVGNSVLDVINTSEFRDLTIIDIEDARRNQWMLVWDYFGSQDAGPAGTGNGGSWSTFLNLYPEFNPEPVRGSPFFFEPAFNLTTHERRKPLFEAGTRWSRSFAGSDISLMAARLYENQLRYHAPASLAGDAIAEKNAFWLLGASANKAIGKLLLKLDVAYSVDVVADTLLPAPATAEPFFSSTRTNRLGTSFGFEYAINNEQNISIGILAERMLSDDGMNPGEELVEDGTSGNVLLRYTNSMRNSTLLLNVTAQSALDGSTLLASVALNYNIDDNWAIMGQVIATQAGMESQLFFLDQDVRIGVTLSCSF